MCPPGRRLRLHVRHPDGRQGSAYLSRVPENAVPDLTKSQYWSGPSWWNPQGSWVTNNPGAATAVIPPAGACAGAGAGATVSEMSAQYNAYLKKYVVILCDQNNSVVIRTADQLNGTWSDAKVLMPQQSGGIYAPMLNPWSPSTLGTAPDLHWNLSVWNDDNVQLMHTDLTKV